MMEKLKELLNRSGADAWEASEETTERQELYFIGHKLDQTRAISVRHRRVKVYRQLEDGQTGAFSGELPEGLSEQETEARIRDFVRYAAVAPNLTYVLNQPRAQENWQDRPFPDAADRCLQAVNTIQSVEETEMTRINSYEVFMSDHHRRLMSSTGIDVEMDYPTSMVEAVVNARDEEREIEVYRMFTGGVLDAATLKDGIRQALSFGSSRLEAGKTPELGQIDVLFTTEAAVPIYEYFIRRMDAAAVYQGLSDWKPGEAIAAREGLDPITITAVPYLSGSSANLPYDAEGAPVHPLTLIRDNIPADFYGSEQFASYLGLESAFIARNFAVTPGSESDDGIRPHRYLEVVEFSDFQVNPVTGDIAGEIRLAYLHDGDKISPVTMGSVSGNMRDQMECMQFSKNTVVYDTLKIPAVTLLCHLNVNGA